MENKLSARLRAESRTRHQRVRRRTLDGAWSLGRVISDGPMSSIYEAVPAARTSLSSPRYAVKVLKEQWWNVAEAIACFRREHILGQRIHCPHVISVLEGRTGSPPYYVVMPLLEATRLDMFTRQTQPIRLSTIFWMIRQTAEAVAALHDEGWIHGDIKPSNILVSPEGHVTLIDLGFARKINDFHNRGHESITGSIDYIAPENLLARHRPDVRSDIYSLGIILYELLTGRLPYHARSLRQLIEQHRTTVPIDIARLVPDLPEPVALLVRRMTSKSPDRRPASPKTLIADLVNLEIDLFEHLVAVE